MVHLKYWNAVTLLSNSLIAMFTLMATLQWNDYIFNITGHRIHIVNYLHIILH